MSSVSKDTVLVVGGAGYIGSHVCFELKQQGFFPVIVDNFSNGHREIAERIQVPIYEGELEDKNFLREVFRAHTFSAAMHFAAFAYVGESVTDPAKYYRNNVAATLSLLEILREFQVKNIIFSSTCATYGIPATLPISELSPQNPVNPYGRSKLMVEQILKDYEAAYGFKSVIFRYFNAAGAHPNGLIGEKHIPETHLIPLVIRAALTDFVLSIFGTDYDTADGTCVRDYIHVLDIASAHILGLKHLLSGGESDIFNIGTGHGYSIQEVISLVEKLTGCAVKRSHHERRAGDPPTLVASSEKLSRCLGWKASYGELQKTLATAIEWEKKERM